MSWQRVRGHEAIARAFDHARQRGRLAHAYLLAGPAGVGKRLFARELAKALLCEGPPGPELAACDRCPACSQVEAGTHPDLLIAGRPEESLELPIDVIRDLCRSFSLKAARGRGKVAILDDADDLNEEAANCFLKTLEEPPPRSLLLLIGSSPDRQLSTIVSRCQVVRFAPLPRETTRAILQENGLEDADLLERVLRLAGGSPGQALGLAEPALWEFRGVLLAGLAGPKVDSVALGKQWMQFVEEAGKEASVQRRRAALVLRLLIELLNDALRLALGEEPRTAGTADLPALSKLAQRLGPERLLDMQERCLEADAHIDRRVQLVLLLEALTDALGQTVAA